MVTKSSGPGWASGTNVTAAEKITQPRRRGKKERVPVGPSRAERERRQLIYERRVRRRRPWFAGFGVGLASAVCWGFVEAFGLLDVAAETTAVVVASVVLLIGFVLTGRQLRVEGGWWRDAGLAAVLSAGYVFWVGVHGPSWATVLALLVGIVVCSARWWKANPVGPGVPLLLPEEAEPEPEPEAVAAPVIDPYVRDWLEYNAKGAAPGSSLTNRRDEGNVFRYDVLLKRGKQTVGTLTSNQDVLAGGLGLDTEQVLFRPVKGRGASVAELTIIEQNVVADLRYFSSPQVQFGTIKGLGRFIDGRGEVEVVMFDAGGTVPTMIVGGTGSGKSAVANQVVVGAISSGVMNLFYIDPKGNSSTALRKRAKVAVIGKENALRAWEIVLAIVEARAAYAIEHDLDTLFPSDELPGWMLLHDEFSVVATDHTCAKMWCQIVNTVRSLGLWPVALSQSLHEGKWGDDQTRAAFASQVIALRINSKSDDLIPGLEYKPRFLPLDLETGQPIPGMCVMAGRGPRLNVPARMDFLPSPSDVLPEGHEMVDGEPRLRTNTALEKFDNQPGPASVDEAALIKLLGEPVDGRWVIGPGGTHSLPDPDAAKNGGGGQGGSKPMKLPFGLPELPGTAKPKGPQPRTESELSDTQKLVRTLINGGTTTVTELVQLSGRSRSTVQEALVVLQVSGFVVKSGDIYVPAPDAVPAGTN